MSAQASDALGHYAPPTRRPSPTLAPMSPTTCARGRSRRTRCPRSHSMVRDIATDLGRYKELQNVPPDQTRNFRNDLYLVGEALRLDPQDGAARVHGRRRGRAQELQEARRRRDEVHPALGQDRRRDRARPRHDGRLEAHRRDGRREDRQGPPDVRAGRSRRDHGDGHDRRGRHVRAARSARRTCSRPASRARWPPTARACRCRRCATCSWRGC